jgi:hypothetical protein
MPMKRMVLKRKENGEDLTRRWGISRFCGDWWLLNSAGGATRDGAFLLSEAELMRFGSDVAYLDIS